MSKTANLSLPLILSSQAQKHVTHNEALLTLDAIVQLCVHSRNINAIPENIDQDNQFIIGENPQGAFEGHAFEIAIFQNNAWVFYKANAGWLAWLKSENQFVVFDGQEWTDFDSASQDTLPQLGINATADMQNRLSINSHGSLFNHDGKDHRLVINKASQTDIGSLIFQSGFSGRAELGLPGDDNFSIKVTPDGENWQSGLLINATTREMVTGPLSVAKQQSDRQLPAFKMTGEATNGTSSGDGEGVGLFLTSNGSSNNRQFAILATDTSVGLRTVIAGQAIILDGFSNGARRDLQLGSNTHGAHVSFAIANTQFSVSNWTGIAQKTVLELAGAADQSGNYLNISSAGGFTNHGDILAVKADGQMNLGGPMKLKSFSLVDLPDATTAGAGSLIYVSDGNDGPGVAFSDGTKWLYVANNTAV